MSFFIFGTRRENDEVVEKLLTLIVDVVEQRVAFNG